MGVQNLRVRVLQFENQQISETLCLSLRGVVAFGVVAFGVSAECRTAPHTTNFFFLGPHNNSCTIRSSSRIWYLRQAAVVMQSVHDSRGVTLAPCGASD